MASMSRNIRSKPAGDDAHALFSELSKPLDRSDVLYGFRSLADRIASPGFQRSVGRAS